MNEDDKSALKEVIGGVGAGMVVLGVFVAIIILLTNITTTTSNPTQSNGEVVGKYKECDIIRWNQNGMAEYKYFLYCENNK
jgi:hypothetical protein